MSEEFLCASCQHAIDASAKICPYCGANPSTGEKVVDTQSLLEEVFQPRSVTTSESVMQYARQRQGVVITVSVFIAFLIFGVVHQFVTLRNSNTTNEAPAVPLSELTDVTKKADETTPVALPPLDFAFDGQPRRMRTYIMEPGAITPPEVVAQQQAAALAQQQKTATAAPAATRPMPPGAAAPRPVPPPATQPQQQRPAPQRPAPPPRR